MTRNMGTTDRLLRVIVGLVLLGFALFGPKAAWGWIGIIPLATAAVGWCPLYTLLGIKTRPG